MSDIEKLKAAEKFDDPDGGGVNPILCAVIFFGVIILTSYLAGAHFIINELGEIELVSRLDDLGSGLPPDWYVAIVLLIGAICLLYLLFSKSSSD